MDDSCRRAGAIPFKWEVCPGTPKHVRSASAAAAPSSCNKVAPKLAPPPFMASPYASPSPYHSPRVSYAYGGGGHRPRGPTAFIDAAPRASSTTDQYAAREAADDAPTATAFRYCFPLPMLRRKGSSKKGTGYGTSGSSSSSSGSSFRSDGEAAPGLRRSASSSLTSMPRGNRRSTFGEGREEVVASTGCFF